MAAAGALIQMAAHRGGAASLDGDEHFRCSQVNQAGGRSMNRWPAAAMISANSRSGRFIYCASFFGLRDQLKVSESRGLAVALRCRSDKCR